MSRPTEHFSLESVSGQVQQGLRTIAQLTDQLREEFHTEEEIVRLNNHLEYEQDNLLLTAKGDRAWTLVVRRSFKKAAAGLSLPQPAHVRLLAQARRAARIGSGVRRTTLEDTKSVGRPPRISKPRQPTPPQTRLGSPPRQMFLKKEHGRWLQRQPVMGTLALGGSGLAACSRAGTAQVSACHALRKSSAQHAGFVRLVLDSVSSHGSETVQSKVPALMAAMVCSAVTHGQNWSPTRVLVDSSSENPPLISQVLADQLGLQGKLAGGFTQADSKRLPLYDVGNLELCVNGKPMRQRFLSAPLAHYGVILGESWLSANEGVLYYAHDTLWQRDRGQLAPMCFDRLPGVNTHEIAWLGARAPAENHKLVDQAQMLAAAVREGVERARMSPLARLDDNQRRSSTAH